MTGLRSLTVPEAGGLKSRCEQGQAPSLPPPASGGS